MGCARANALAQIHMRIDGALALLVALTLAVAATGCGGDDDGGSETAPRASAAGPTRSPGGQGNSAGGPVEPTGGMGTDGAAGASPAEGAVDLRTDPSSIPAAIVTGSGVVQTRPPSAQAHRVAQANSYGSIKGFGGETEGDEATDITFALVQYLTAKAEGDWATACARLYSPLVPGLRQLAGTAEGAPPDCPGAFARALERVPRATLVEQAQIDVSSVRRDDGTRAFVIYKTPGTVSADMPMFLEDGVWKVGAIEAFALTPEQVG